MLFAATQNFREIKSKVETERRGRSVRQTLREEIMAYATLKNAWGLGHIECKFVCTLWQILSEGSPTVAWQKLSETLLCHKRTLQDFYEQTPQSVYLGA